MKISEIIKELEELKKEMGDIDLTADFRDNAKKLYYDPDLEVLFGY
jgi:hypothetical protein